MHPSQNGADLDRLDWVFRFVVWRRLGKQVVGYGAAAKATVWLNWIGVDTDWMRFVVDETPEKQELFIPGTDLRILPSVALRPYGGRPVADIVVILAHNWTDEILEKIPPGPEVWTMPRGRVR